MSQRYGISIHCDGARLLNAAVASKKNPADLCSNMSSVSLCLSKGIGAPVGSVLVGDRDFIQEARRFRKALGGAGRQVGVLAAAALVGLDHAEENIQRDHENAKMIARSEFSKTLQSLITSDKLKAQLRSLTAKATRKKSKFAE